MTLSDPEHPPSDALREAALSQSEWERDLYSFDHRMRHQGFVIAIAESEWSDVSRIEKWMAKTNFYDDRADPKRLAAYLQGIPPSGQLVALDSETMEWIFPSVSAAMGYQGIDRMRIEEYGVVQSDEPNLGLLEEVRRPHSFAYRRPDNVIPVICDRSGSKTIRRLHPTLRGMQFLNNEPCAAPADSLGYPIEIDGLRGACCPFSLFNPVSRTLYVISYF